MKRFNLTTNALIVSLKAVTNTSKNLFAILLTLFVIYSCDKKINLPIQELDSPPLEIVTLNQQNNISVDMAMSAFSPMQANSSGLYLTPSHCDNDSVLFRYKNLSPNDNNARVQGVVARGNSNYQAERILFSTKSVQDDTLIFYSGASAKLLTVANNGSISQMGFTNKQLSFIGYSFAYNNNHLFISIEPLFQRNYLLSILNIRTGEVNNVFPLRVPHGYQPAERNHISAMAAVPDGVVFAFTGDRKFYFMNYDGIILREIVLGESDPIPSPFKTEQPDTLERSPNYISKMEYEDQFLHILVDDKMWILNAENYEPVTRLEFVDPLIQETAFPVDFSITNQQLFLKLGGQKIYWMTRDTNWYPKNLDDSQFTSAEKY